jgi:hypothetical protein
MSLWHSLEPPPHTMVELTLTLPNGTFVPQLAFGLYKVPADDEGVTIISEAIKVSVWEATRIAILRYL